MNSVEVKPVIRDVTISPTLNTASVSLFSIHAIDISTTTYFLSATSMLEEYEEVGPCVTT